MSRQKCYLRRSISIISLLVFALTMVYYSDLVIAESDYYLELGERVLKQGKEGPDVAILQQKLSSGGYFEGRIDGHFNSETKQAVKKFQKEHELTVDGILGPKTNSRLSEEELTAETKFSRSDIIDLARVIYGEARGEGLKGKIAVGAVILNRVNNENFSDSIREVILENGQFSSIFDGQAYNYFPSEECIEAARMALLGYDPTGGALFFYNPEVANLEWISARKVIGKIDDHVFAK